MAAARASDVAELELESSAFAVRVRRDLSQAAEVNVLVAPRRDGTYLAAPVAPERTVAVLAPLTGVFYRAATPTARPYVSEGDWVDPQTVIGLIETMKIYNEVTADRSGQIVAFHVQTGELVQAGARLVSLEPAERTAAEREAL